MDKIVREATTPWGFDERDENDNLHISEKEFINQWKERRLDGPVRTTEMERISIMLLRDNKESRERIIRSNKESRERIRVAEAETRRSERCVQGVQFISNLLIGMGLCFLFFPLAKILLELLLLLFCYPRDGICHIHPIGEPEWTSNIPNLSRHDMCPTCILCHDIPDPPPYGDPFIDPRGKDPFMDARFMEWFKSWPGSVTTEDLVKCIC